MDEPLALVPTHADDDLPMPQVPKKMTPRKKKLATKVKKTSPVKK